MFVHVHVHVHVAVAVPTVVWVVAVSASGCVFVGCCCDSLRCHSQLHLMLPGMLVHIVIPLGHCSHFSLSPFGHLWPLTGCLHCLQWCGFTAVTAFCS